MSSLAPGRSGVPQSRLTPASGSLRSGRLMLAILILLGLAPPAYLLQTGGALTTGYEIQKLERERTGWLNRNQQLEVEIARARSLIWVEHEAVHRLGMQRPTQTAVVRMESVPQRTEARLLRRGGEPIPARPIEEGPSWVEALGSVTANLGRGD